jgi:hypothetical protein
MSEGLNSNIQKIKSLVCGFRNMGHFDTALYFTLRKARYSPMLNLNAPLLR